jgi:23S rRNA (guanosine2251-2'-O)-methyltransferase
MSSSYDTKKQFFDNLLTIYGRKPVLEALRDPDIPIYRLHLAETNQRSGILKEIEQLAGARNIDLQYHSRETLSRISKNRTQDQGVAADLQCPGYSHYQTFLAGQQRAPYQLIAVDRVTNPQNLGMIIRSVCASPLHGLLLPSKGCAPLSPLVIKASAGTLFKSRILRCDRLASALRDFANAGADICVLTGSATTTLAQYRPDKPVVYVLGNETEGVSDEVRALASTEVRIPMNNRVESLNVATTATLLAFRNLL